MLWGFGSEGGGGLILAAQATVDQDSGSVAAVFSVYWDSSVGVRDSSRFNALRYFSLCFGRISCLDSEIQLALI